MPSSLPAPAASVRARQRFAIPFAPTPHGASRARHQVAERLHAWGYPPTSPAHDHLTLIAAELLSNAVRHVPTPGPHPRLRLTATSAVLHIAVTDHGAGTPHLAGDTYAENGRGLLLISQLATRWGLTAYPHTTPPGKTVWAELGLRSPR